MVVAVNPHLCAWIYRFCAPAALLLAFLGMSYLYKSGYADVYETVLRSYGVVPFRFPFVDISGALAAWECARQGIDVISSTPCDVLHRSFNYSPLWTAAAGIPLKVADTTAVGWTLDLLFILSLSVLPPPKCGRELILVLMATLSTMIAFALERANLDILLFMMALAAGLVSEGRLAFRLCGYCLALLAALLKYYPVTILIIAFRERVSVLLCIALIAVGMFSAFCAVYHDEIARGLPLIASGRYDTDLFSAKNLPFLIGMIAESVAGSSRLAALVGEITTVCLYAALLGVCIAVCRSLLRAGELSAALASLPRLERVLLLIGSAVIGGCFFAGQNIGYRGVFLLMIMPGLLALSRSRLRDVRVVSLGTSFVIVLLMWGECLRLALADALEHSGLPGVSATEVKIQFWLLRELCWWWTVGVLLAVLADFLRDSPIVRRTALLLERLPAQLW